MTRARLREGANRNTIIRRKTRCELSRSFGSSIANPLGIACNPSTHCVQLYQFEQCLASERLGKICPAACGSGAALTIRSSPAGGQTSTIGNFFVRGPSFNLLAFQNPLYPAALHPAESAWGDALRLFQGGASIPSATVWKTGQFLRKRQISGFE